jgi:endoglucanase Acf2
MNRPMLLLLGFLISLGALSTFVSRSDSASAAKPKVSAKFEEYRAALKKAYQVDIVHFKDRIKGGYADGKAITDYKLTELIEGIKFEREHTNDSLLALEMAMDHFERIPDYYSHLANMERACASEKLLEK